METVQNYPTADSVPTDSFEGLVAAYYQLKGYITSSNKWFWVRDENKKQRGYQDIDVLAIGQTETIIVSVTANLDDKVRRTRDGSLRTDMLDKLNARHLVIGHTVSKGSIRPRAGGAVIMIDVGMSAMYGGPAMCLVIERGKFYQVSMEKKEELRLWTDGEKKEPSESARED